MKEFQELRHDRRSGRSYPGRRILILTGFTKSPRVTQPEALAKYGLGDQVGLIVARAPLTAWSSRARSRLASC